MEQGAGAWLDRFRMELEVIIRECTEEDLPRLEWFGLFTAHRGLIERAWRRHRRGENLFLVAEAQGFPVGQVWVDLTRKAAESAGLVWALRVFPLFQGRGVGTRLMGAAEQAMRARGVPISEVGVEKDNPGARRLYERLGYRVVSEWREEYDYITPEGHTVRALTEQWVLHKRLG